MKVRLYDTDEKGNERFFTTVDLRECYADDDEEAYQAARAELERYGRVWIGGGSCAAFLAMLDRS